MPTTILDLTRAIPSTEQELLDKFETRFGPLVPAQATVLCFADQDQAFRGLGSKVTVSVVPGARHWRTVVDLVFEHYIKERLVPGWGNTVTTIVSFNPAVLNLSKSIPVSERARFKFLHWQEVKTGEPLGPHAPVLGNFPLSSVEDRKSVV